MGLQALVFDVDGTVAETERDGHRVAFNQAFAEAGLPIVWSESVYGALLQVSGGKERIAYYVQHFAPHLQLPAEDVERLHRRKNEIFGSLAPRLALRPGVRRLLREAREAGLRLAVATTTSPENAVALLEAHGLAGFFEFVGAGDAVSRKKPAPDIYRLVLDRLRLAPEEGVAVEDSRNGVLAARSAGLPVLVTPSFYTRRESFPGALAVVEHLGEPDLPARILQGPVSGRVVVTPAWIAQLLSG